MKITSIETFTNEFVCFVRVTTEDGSKGWGQTAPYYADIIAEIIHRQVAPYVLGQSSDNIDALVDLVNDREHKFPGSHLRRAIGGIDLALWDWKGKQAGKPVCELIGGTPGKIRAYASSMKRDITPADEVRRFKKLQQELGFDAFKFRIGSECGHDQDEWPGRTEAIVSEVRKGLGENATLLVDANSCYSPAKAIEVGKYLEGHGVTHYEEPCPYWEYEQTKEVTEALSLDITGGEQDCEISSWKHIIEEKIVDILQPDICYLGGLSRTLQVTRMAEEAGMICTPHSANLSLVTLFTMHLIRAIPNAGSYLEFSIEEEDYYPWQYGLLMNDPYKIEDGKVTVDSTPGWGAEISPEWLDKASYQISEMA
ncbi:MAG: mandelate racemase/muconate lactonizing enzyme family protein [Sneathiella sp.]|nr:mandelate racemase/muconate lactonizing enzyme family protein [Sneathiella sp.]